MYVQHSECVVFVIVLCQESPWRVYKKEDGLVMDLCNLVYYASLLKQTLHITFTSLVITVLLLGKPWRIIYIPFHYKYVYTLKVSIAMPMKFIFLPLTFAFCTVQANVFVMEKTCNCNIVAGDIRTNLSYNTYTEL